MGSREQNFYNQLAVRMGYGDAADEVQDLYLAGKHRDAAAAVPQEFIDATSLIGTDDRGSPTGCRRTRRPASPRCSVSPYVGDLESGIATLRTVAEAYEESGVAELVATVLLLRHGRTTANAAGGLAGRQPVELDDTGRGPGRRGRRAAARRCRWRRW